MRRLCLFVIAATAMLSNVKAQTVAGFSASPLTTCTGYVQFTDTSSGGPTQFRWDFGDGGTSAVRNPLHQYATNGSYDVTLIANGPNGADTVKKAAYIIVNRPAAPTGKNDTVQCGQGSSEADLTAMALNGGPLMWYDVLTGGVPLDSGDTFSTALAQTTTYYVQENQLGSLQKVGPVDNTFDAGTNHTELDYGLFFNAMSPFILKSVKVYAQGAGPRTIEVKSAVGGTVLHSRTVDLTDGENRVVLDFPIDPRNGYFIQINGVPNLFRNQAGASYPYTISNVVSIVRSNAGGQADFTYYYYFYDWEVQEITCQSERAAVTGVVSGPAGPATVNDTTCPGGGIVNLLASGNNGGDLNWYDAPTGGNLVDTGNVHTESITGTVTYYVSEVVHAPAVNVGPPDNTFGTGNNFSTQNNVGLVFDVLAPLTIRSVKVYAQGGGNRTINVYDAIGGNIVHTLTVNIPDGESRVNLNFLMNPGTDYYITTLSPQDLYRNNSGPSYPYTVTDLISIKTSNAGQPLDYYYYFYDWDVEPSPCESERTPVSGVVRSGQGITLATSTTDANCNGGSEGSIDLTVAGGTAPFAFAWSDGQTTEDATGLPAGTYSVTATDANGCTAEATDIVGEPTAISVSANVIDATCGNADGLIDISVTGGTPSYTYLWSNGGTTQDAGNLAAGSYSVTVTDGRGCTKVHTEQVSDTGGPAVTSSVTQPACSGGNDAVINLTVGGPPNSTFLWSTGATTEDISGLTAGTYTVTVTGQLGCQTLETITVTDPAGISITEFITDAKCNGGSDGSIDITVTGGVPSYTFNWSTGATTEDISGIPAGTYVVTVTDANGCSDSLKPMVNQPGPINLTTSATDESCQPGSDGTASVTASGGVGPYSYQWDDAASQTAATATGLMAGTYNVTVSDKGGCSNTTSINVDKPGVTLATSATDATCNGGADGSIDITVAGGAAPFTYLWSNGATTEDVSGLAAGSYTVTVTDANGCSDSGNEMISEPTAIDLTASVTSPSCGNNDGLIDLSVTGGSPAYSYLWSNGATTQDAGSIPSGSYTVTVTDAKGCTATLTRQVNDQGGPAPLTSSYTTVSCNGGNDGTATITPGGGSSPFDYLWDDGQTDQTATGLQAGDYGVTVTDNNGCMATDIVTVQEATAITPVATVTHVKCSGGNDGMIDLTVSGGVPAYFFAWEDGSTTEDLGVLTAGTYSVTITDALGCSKVDSFDIMEPAPILTTVTVQNASCSGINDGSATVTPSGGVAPYTYLWSDAGNQTDSTATGLAAGSYTVTVTDKDGCTVTANANVTAPNIVAASSASPVSCNGGSDGYIDVTVAGGLGPYSFAWSNGATTEDIYNMGAGTYTVTVTDANGCASTGSDVITEPAAIDVTAVLTQPSCGNNDGLINISVAGGTPGYTYIWSHGATSQDAGSIGVGTYTVTVTDANGCVATHTENLSNVGGPGPLTLSSTDVSCNSGNDGSITVNASGGAPPLSYSWDNGATDQTLTGMGAGTYAVTVTDNNGCMAVASGNVGEPAAIVLDLAASDIACNGQTNGAIDLTVSGGSPAFTFLWSNGETTEDLNGLSAGVYTVTATDNNGCASVDSSAVMEPVALSLTTAVTNASCNGVADGSVTVNASGGTMPYTYLWDDAASQTSATATGLTAGTYNVTVTDTSGCMQSTQAVVNQPTITVALSSTPASCNGIADGSIDLTAVGGATPYMFMWSNGATTEDLGGLMAGSYTVTVTDANGCTGVNTETVTEPVAINVTATVVNSTCGNANGLIDVSVSGGSPGYTYLWNHGVTSQDAGSLSAGIYTVTVTDASGCSKTLTRSISDQGAPALATAPSDVRCNGGNDGAIDLTVSGGVTPYTFAWSNGASTEDISGLTAGTYNVTVTAGNGCIATQVVTVGEPAPIMPNITAQNESCFGCADGSAMVSPGGGTPGYTYVWNDGNAQTTATATGLTTGTYYVTVTDANGCTAIDSVEVSFAVGVVGLVEDHTVVLYPNPTRDVVHIGGEGLRYLQSVEIFDMAGRRLELPLSADNSIDMSPYPSGIYLVKANFNNRSYKTYRIYKH